MSDLPRAPGSASTVPEPVPNSRTAVPDADGERAKQGQVDAITRHGGDADDLNRQPRPAPPGPDSQGSRAGSTLGSAAPSTGLADGEPGESSQGLTGAQGSGGGAERPPGGRPAGGGNG